MAISIRNPHVERLARKLARETGTTMTDAIFQALEEKVMRIERRSGETGDLRAIMEISARSAALPTLDERSEDEILGYSDNDG